MSDRKIIATGEIAGTYGPDTVKIEQLKRGRHAGRFVTRGAGFAGRVAYASADTARRAVERHARFAGWVGEA
ncbi:hypothetical protein [Stakelama pacifica]|uniref:Uncharacterized protein n=1 Tax=Stakelama pacifica TaxID=517720 RepID=A0A4R6FN10_9SPHN|nr:hypothetical protein [Stakelama pacifica]TDN82989.1 hypothetical protein EV664_105187 [Stakelama pacifica]GGO94993.1 hypothetical protein GCM10011329_18130 [Stakelama pacifica]